MDAESFARNFPATKEIPLELWELFRYQEQTPADYSGHFRLRDDLSQIPFQESLRPSFVPFACDADGSFYAFWLYGDFSLASAPIVFLSFDGSANAILANNLTDFISLLSLGIDELGYVVQEDPNWHLRGVTGSSITQFRVWLQRRLSVVVPQYPQRIVENAQGSHPDLGIWLAAHCAKI